MTTLISSYTNPDIDGFACSYAYAELLNKLGRDVQYGFFGDLQKEAFIVAQMFKIEYSFLVDFSKYNSFILLDLSDKLSVPDGIDIGKVIELIDHRKNNDRNIFVNAVVEISRESAILLYCAIQSGTIKLSNGVTTDRDREAIKYLEEKYKLDENLIDKIFCLKSIFGDDIKKLLYTDTKVFSFDFGKTGIVQLEISNVNDFFLKKEKEIEEAFLYIKEKKELENIFANFIDIVNKSSFFVCFDKKLCMILEKKLLIKFDGNIVKYHKLLMRKELTLML